MSYKYFKIRRFFSSGQRASGERGGQDKFGPYKDRKSLRVNVDVRDKERGESIEKKVVVMVEFNFQLI